MVDLDIVKSMTDLCDGGALITVMILNPFDANGHSESCDGYVLGKQSLALGGTYYTKSLYRNGSVPTNKMSEEVDRNHPMTTHHRGAEEARRAHNPKDG